MKKILIALVCLVSTTVSAQQYMRIWSGGDYKQVDLQKAGDMPFNDGTSLTVAGKEYSLVAVDSITFGACVTVRYNGTEAAVNIPELVRGVTAEVKGANVTITNTNVAEELEFVLSGVSQSGSFTYNGSYKTTLTLDGLNLTSTAGAAMDIKCGKRIKIDMAKGTTNKLEDAAGGSQKAALYCKGHLELSGGGTLEVKGNTAHAISTKEYLQIKKSIVALKVTGAVKDGIHAGQYMQVNGGEIVVTGNKGDAIQVEALLDDAGNIDASEELNGQMIVKGGAIMASATTDDAHVLKADGDITISGGTLVLDAKGAGSRCIDADANVTVNEDNAATKLVLSASGAKYDDGTGDTSRSRLGKIDKDLTLAAGTITATITKPAKGFKVDGTFYKLGGSISGTKDGANASASDLVEAAGGVKTSK